MHLDALKARETKRMISFFHECVYLCVCSKKACPLIKITWMRYLSEEWVFAVFMGEELVYSAFPSFYSRSLGLVRTWQMLLDIPEGETLASFHQDWPFKHRSGCKKFVLHINITSRLRNWIIFRYLSLVMIVKVEREWNYLFRDGFSFFFMNFGNNLTEIFLLSI